MLQLHTCPEFYPKPIDAQALRVLTAGLSESRQGMAGMAVRSGARSTIATLWQVNIDAAGDVVFQLLLGLKIFTNNCFSRTGAMC